MLMLNIQKLKNLKNLKQIQNKSKGNYMKVLRQITYKRNSNRMSKRNRSKSRKLI